MIPKQTLKTNFIIFMLLSSYLSWDVLNTGVNIGPAGSTSGNPIASAVTSNGKFVFVHQAGMNQIKSLLFEVFDTDGGQYGPKTFIDETDRNALMYDNAPSVAADKTNGFAIILNLRNGDKKTATESQIYGYYFNSDYDLIGHGAKSPMLNTKSLLDTCLVYLPDVNMFAAFYEEWDNANANYSINRMRLSADDQLAAVNVDYITQTGNTSIDNMVSVNLGNNLLLVVYSVFDNDIFEMSLQGTIFLEDSMTETGPGLKVKDTKLSAINPAVELLKTSAADVILVWAELDFGEIWGQLYTVATDKLVEKDTTFKISNLDNSCNFPVVKYLGIDGFIVAYRCEETPASDLWSAYFRLYTGSSVAVGGERQMDSQSSSIDANVRLSPISGNRLMLAYSKGTLIYFELFYLDTTPCSDFTHYITDKSDQQIVFNLPNALRINIRSLPANGSLTDSFGAVNQNTDMYDKNDLYYQPSSVQDDFFNYGTNYLDASCKVTISTSTPPSPAPPAPTCYTSCKTCDETGNLNDHMCTSCDNPAGYFKLVDKPANCVNLQPNGYFLKSTTWEKCYLTCNKCTGYPVDINVDMRCMSNSCIPGYYPKVDNMTSCFQGSVQGYTLVGSVYQKSTTNCYIRCKSCSGYPINPDVDMMCDPNSCASGYYPKINNMTSCFNGVITGFYFDGYVYQKCFSLCKTCKGYPANPSIDMKCDTCLENYYTSADNPSSCYSGDIDLFYLDSSIKIYKPCQPSCQSCSSGPDSNGQNCKKCKEEYYPVGNNISNCFKKDDQTLDGYYFNNTQFNKCYSVCKTCKGPGSLANPNCITCKDGENCEPCNDIIYNNQCMTSCPDGTLHDQTNNTCYNCKDKNKLSFESTCVDTCPSGYIIIDNLCVSCKSKKMLNNNGQCVEKCPEGTLKSDDRCLSCKTSC
jgi:hypothetical protein